VGGRHHYPAPITDIDLIKRDDFTLWVTDPTSGAPVAVLPAGRRGSGNGAVRVAFVQPGTELHDQHVAAEQSGEAVVLPAGSPMARQAFARQDREPPVPNAWAD
jgi:hypothetical protein